MKHVDPKDLVVVAPPPHPLEAWARRIEQARNFNITDGHCCAVWHARDMGLLHKKPSYRIGDPSARCNDGCACNRCCDWVALGELCGINTGTIGDIWGGMLGKTREQVSASLRSYIPGNKRMRPRVATADDGTMDICTMMRQELASIVSSCIPTDGLVLERDERMMTFRTVRTRTGRLEHA